MAKSEVRWIVVKDYYRDGDNLTDTWVILYGTEKEANEAKARLEAGQDKSWYDPADLEASAFLYIDQITINDVPWVEVDQETAYGSTVRLSRSVRVFG